MKAIVYPKYGDVLQLKEVEKPVPKEGFLDRKWVSWG
jgi:hypothetical protein